MLLSNDFLKATIEPVMRHAASDRWRFDFAPHDLGQYPLANGQVYGTAAKEVALYKTKLKPFGLPVDNRSKSIESRKLKGRTDLGKLDWQVWTATMAAPRASGRSTRGGARSAGWKTLRDILQTILHSHPTAC